MPNNIHPVRLDSLLMSRMTPITISIISQENTISLMLKGMMCKCEAMSTSPISTSTIPRMALRFVLDLSMVTSNMIYKIKNVMFPDQKYINIMPHTIHFRRTTPHRR